MKTGLNRLIALHRDDFSKGQRRIAAYITEHYDEAAYMTALRLGETVGVSESTVVRFAAELGFDGYPELQKAMQEMVRARLTSLQRIDVTASRMKREDVLTSVLSFDLANLRQTLDELPREVFDGAAEALVAAREVYIFGAGSCAALASFAAYYLQMLLGNVHLIRTSGQAQIIENMIQIGAQDVFLEFSFPRYSSNAGRTVSFARSRGAKVIAVTDSLLSPIAGFADYLLLSHSDMTTVVDSLVAPLSILNALIVAISVSLPQERRDLLGKLEQLWAEYEVYQTVEDPPHE